MDEAEIIYFKNWTLSKFRQINSMQSVYWFNTRKCFIWCEEAKDIEISNNRQAYFWKGEIHTEMITRYVKTLTFGFLARSH